MGAAPPTMLGPGRGSVAPSASRLQSGYPAGAGSQPASAWGQASHQHFGPGDRFPVAHRLGAGCGGAVRRSDEVDGDAELVADTALRLQATGFDADCHQFLAQAHQADFEGRLVELFFGLAHERGNLKAVQAALG